MDKKEWIEPGHPILSVRQQAEILGLNRSTKQASLSIYNKAAYAS